MGTLLLSEALLEDLIAWAQADPSNDSGPMRELLDRFERLARKIGRTTTSVRDLQDDATNAARWGLVRAVRAHTPGTAGFPSFAALHMRGEAGRRARKLTDPRTLPTDNFAGLDRTSGDAGPDEQALAVEFSATVDALTPSQRDLAVRRYVDDEPLAQIATELGVTVSAVSQRLSTIHRKLQGSRPPAPERRAA